LAGTACTVLTAGALMASPASAAPAPTTTALTLSAHITAFGHEQSEHLVVTVTPSASGTPTGTVTVTAGSTVICEATLASGQGDCTLAAAEFLPGIYHLTATYQGDTNFSGSASAPQALAVLPPPGATPTPAALTVTK
jgi:hypothetical protein